MKTTWIQIRTTPETKARIRALAAVTDEDLGPFMIRKALEDGSGLAERVAKLEAQLAELQRGHDEAH